MMKPITNLQKPHPINESTNFIKIFFYFTYYLGVSPFRIIKSNAEKDQDVIFQIFEWKPQKVYFVITKFNFIKSVNNLTNT